MSATYDIDAAARALVPTEGPYAPLRSQVRDALLAAQAAAWREAVRYQRDHGMLAPGQLAALQSLHPEARGL